MKTLYRYILSILVLATGLQAQDVTAIYKPAESPAAAYELPVPAAILPYAEDSEALRAAERLAEQLTAFPGATSRLLVYPPDVFEQQREMLGIGSVSWQDTGLRQKAANVLGIRLAFVISLETDGALLLRVYDLQSGTKRDEQTFVSSLYSGPLYDAALYLAADSLANYTRTVEPVEVIEGMKFIQGGYMLLGSDEGQEDEQPVTAMAVGDFHMDTFEVTVEQYQGFCTASGKQMPAQPEWSTSGHPVVNVAWADAAAYAKWAGKRLPTEAEWEYAASGGRKSRGHALAGANDPDAAGWYWDNAGREAQPVGQKLANELGLYDLSGNVFEWCADWYVPYSESGNRDTSGRYKVIRGGSWYTAAGEMRVSNRYRYSPAETWNNNIGFRCVKNAER